MKQKIVFVSDFHFQGYDIKAVQKWMSYTPTYQRLGDSMTISVDPGEQNMWWTDKKGRQIRIDKMDTKELRQAMHRVKRWIDNDKLAAPNSTPRRKAIHRNMQEEYYKRIGPAGEVLFGNSK